MATRHGSTSTSRNRRRHDDVEGKSTAVSKCNVLPWEAHRGQLARIFFREQDVITRGTPEYNDFWAFIKKFQSYQQQKKKEKPLNNNEDRESNFGLPKNYAKRYRVNFSITTGDIEGLVGRMPIDLDDRDGLTREKITEFRSILMLYLDFCQRQKFTKLIKLRSSQRNLPVTLYRTALIDALEKTQVLIVAGDTGCGKSTQVPQYLLEAGYEHIACTQPRRIACIALSKRVAFETLNEYSSDVGYQIRFERTKTKHTKILFLTEGLLLRQIAVDSMLLAYSVIVLDEVHERHLHGDFLLGVMKCLVKQRPDVKLVLMSATINLELFQKYFWNAPVIQVPGRLYPIKVMFCPVSVEEQSSRSERISPAPYLKILSMIDDKYPEVERGDLLIFLSGMTEISTVVEAIQAYAHQTKRWIVLPLHSTLSIAEQDKVFDIAPQGVRKCIVSTNIAETSITIDGIRFVADSGKVKEVNYDPTCKMQKLQEFWISKASAEQRKGRAGRTGPGVCYRLFSEADFSAMADYATPEIHRVPLVSQILHMIALGIPDVRKFPFIEPPPLKSIEEAVLSLKEHGAITNEEELTSIGKMLSDLPVDITIGKLLIMGSLFDKIGPVLSLAAALSVQSPFTNRSFREPDMLTARRSLESNHGDPFCLLNAYNAWLELKAGHNSNNSRKWCRHRGFEEQRFYEMTKIRKQFEELLKDSGLAETNRRRNWESMSSVERSQRHGELRQLRGMKREFQRAPKKQKLLKMDMGFEQDMSDDDEPDIRNIDFKLQNDDNQVKELSLISKDITYKDVSVLKIILCSGLYPQFALADEHNSYKVGSDQIFHTKVKPFVVLHPLGVFANQPEALHLNDDDIQDAPGVKGRHGFSSRNQLLVFKDLLETTKPYLMTSMRVSSIHSLLLFSHSIDTNHDFTRLVFDSWLDVRFLQAECGQDLILQAMEIRRLWETILHLKLNKENCSSDVQITRKVISFLQEETVYSIRRLLAADIKDLHRGGANMDRQSSFQTPTFLGPITRNPVKGGFQLSNYLTYDSLQEGIQGDIEPTAMKFECPFCSATMTVGVLDRMHHMITCREIAEKKGNIEATVEGQSSSSSSAAAGSKKPEFFCEKCQQKLFLSNTEILKHKRSHLK